VIHPCTGTIAEQLSDIQQQQKDVRFLEAPDFTNLFGKANQCWSDERRRKRNVSNIGNDFIQSESFNRLKPGIQLNDEIISFYMRLLNKRENEKEVKKSYFFSPFFVTNLLFGESKGYDYNKVKKWTNGITISEYEKLFFPIFIGQCHWTLAVMYIRDKKIEYYDSMRGLGADFLMKGLWRWLGDERTLKKLNLPESEINDWEFINKNPRHIPQQNNGIDCGLYLIMNADFLSDNVPITRDTYSHLHMLYFRNKIAVDILRKSLCYGIVVDASGDD
jgi:sentrin-specific protease 1